MIHHFHDHDGFIDAFVHRIKQYNHQSYDHVIISYHGLPLNHVHEAHNGNTCETMGCAEKRDDENSYCYLASCYETSRLLAEIQDEGPSFGKGSEGASARQKHSNSRRLISVGICHEIPRR